MRRLFAATIILAMSWLAVSAKCGDLVYRTKPSEPTPPPAVCAPPPIVYYYAPNQYPMPRGPWDMVPMPSVVAPPVYVPTMQARPLSPPPITLRSLPGGGYECYPTPNIFRIYPMPGMGYPQFLTNGYGYYQAPPIRYDNYNYNYTFPPYWPPVPPKPKTPPCQPEPDNGDTTTAQ